MPVIRSWLYACMLLGSLLAIFPEPARAAPAAYSVAVVPVLPPTEIKRRWQPLLDQLGRETGLSFHFRLYEDNATFEASLLQSEPDFAMIGPYHLWKIRPRYIPALRNAAPMIGLVVVHRDSSLQTLKDLQGRTLAMPNGNDMTMGVILNQNLRILKVTPQLRPQRTHANGLRAVALGKVDAALIDNYSLQLLPAKLIQQLRIIHRSAPIPAPAFSYAPRIPEEDVRKVKEAFLRMHTTQPALMKAALMPNITEADLERDYGVLSRMLTTEAAHAQP